MFIKQSFLNFTIVYIRNHSIIKIFFMAMKASNHTGNTRKHNITISTFS